MAPSAAAADRAAAFFDLDKTLMAGSSGMPFARVARRHGLVTRGQIARWGIDHLRYRLRGTTDDATQEVLEVAKETLADVPLRDVARMWPEVLAGILPRIYPQMLDEVYAHQDAGRATFIVSAAGNDGVQALARVLGMEGGIGTSYETDAQGTYTGRLAGPFVYGEGKVEAIQRFADEHGIELSASYAYSDSVSDLPMLRAVGHPVAVNPDPALATVAKQEGWQVMRFEKLGRRLGIAGATVLAAAVGWGGSQVASRRRATSRSPVRALGRR